SAGDDLGIRMGHPEGHRVLNALRLIQGFHIIHEWFPPLVFDQPSLFESAVEDMGRDRACVKGHTCGVQNGVADGRRRRTGRGLAQGLGAVGRGGLRVFHERRLERGMVHKGGQLVVQQIVVQGLSGLLVE
ncbi:RNA polymerase sigma factor, partial [Dysosmobacter welbionis]